MVCKASRRRRYHSLVFSNTGGTLVLTATKVRPRGSRSTRRMIIGSLDLCEDLQALLKSAKSHRDHGSRKIKVLWVMARVTCFCVYAKFSSSGRTTSLHPRGSVTNIIEYQLNANFARVYQLIVVDLDDLPTLVLHNSSQRSILPLRRHGMSYLLGVQQPLRTRFILLHGRLQCISRIRELHPTTVLSVVRFASRSKPLPSAPQAPLTKKAAHRRGAAPNSRKQQPDSKKATLLLNRLNKAGKNTSQSKGVQPSSPNDFVKQHDNIQTNGPVTEIEIDEHERAIQQRIAENRTKLLWPGIWTFFAITGTYGAFAYLDARYNGDASPGTTLLAERTELPQTWYLTPEVIKKGVKAGWNELDKLTIGIVVASIAVHLMKKSPLPFWEKLIHITGEKKYTAFTYPFVHSKWSHVAQNMFLLCWFLPGVVRYLDGDTFQAAALLVTVPLITTYLERFAYRWGLASALIMNMGSSGSIAAVCGAFCMAYPNEKVWLPSFVILRLDAIYWGALFVFWQFTSMMKTPKGGNRPAYMVSLLGSGI